MSAISHTLNAFSAHRRDKSSRILFRTPRAQERCKITTVFECFLSSPPLLVVIPNLDSSRELRKRMHIFRPPVLPVRRTYVVILRNVERRRGNGLRKLPFYCVRTTEKHAKKQTQYVFVNLVWQSFLRFSSSKRLLPGRTISRSQD